MPILELPHTSGCLVCGPANPHGLKLSLFVESDTDVVSVRFIPEPHHIGFQGIVHGGVIATVLDEAMVWAASWSGKRFCVCGELSLRFRNKARAGIPMICQARIESRRPRLILTTAQATDETGAILATSTGKYVPLSPDEHSAFVATFIPTPTTDPAGKFMVAGMDPPHSIA